MATVSMAEAIRRMQQNIKEKQNLAISLITSQVVETSPTLHGDYKASHSPNDSLELKEGNILISEGSSARHDYASIINNLPAGGSYSLSNHLSYASKIEFTDHSAQGTLIYTSAIENWSDHVQDAIRDIGDA